MNGRRVMPDAAGYLKADSMREPGSYGRATFDFAAQFGPGAARHNWWDVRAPDGSTCVLNPSVHTVTEHEDGTITVHPSIAHRLGMAGSSAACGGQYDRNHGRKRG